MKPMLATNVKEMLTECFDSDPALLTHWHIAAGTGLESCVERTLNDLGSVTVYKLMNDQDLIGYFGKEEADGELFLTGFFIKPKFRKIEVISKFWSIVLTEFKRPFFCGLYEKNKPAISFIQRFGAYEVTELNLPDGLAKIYKLEM
jgi:hypothetical protein